MVLRSVCSRTPIKAGPLCFLPHAVIGDDTAEADFLEDRLLLLAPITNDSVAAELTHKLLLKP